ncbi:hypothetical protein Cgig2_024577 [Carnegiea gigantea]|uniref:Uncharacterized protein n=1 Tax=Carnegiea gigantea TaxID=171969 RepID=A0A9Q1KH56_9CARY|nr:hypothetical protein Cgig2_024577 [Carnegiea gigantea]
MNPVRQLYTKLRERTLGLVLNGSPIFGIIFLSHQQLLKLFKSPGSPGAPQNRDETWVVGDPGQGGSQSSSLIPTSHISNVKYDCQHISFMPILVLAARLCPEGVEATLFATLMSISNAGSVLGGLIGAGLTQYLMLEPSLQICGENNPSLLHLKYYYVPGRENGEALKHSGLTDQGKRIVWFTGA